MNKKYVVGGIIAGALVATGAVLLLNSEKGNDLRKKISGRIKELGGKAADNARNALQSKLRKASNKVDEYHNDLQHAIS